MYISLHIQYWCDVALICASLSLLEFSRENIINLLDMSISIYERDLF